MATRVARNPGVAGRMHPMFEGCRAEEMADKMRGSFPFNEHCLTWEAERISQLPNKDKQPSRPTRQCDRATSTWWW